MKAYRLLEVISDAAPLARHLEAPLVGRERERSASRRTTKTPLPTAPAARSPLGLRGSASRASSPTSSNEWATRPTSSAAGARHTARKSPTGRSSRCSYRWESSPRPWSHPPPRRPGVAFRRLLEARAAERPQVVVVDDLQWAEPVFVDLVEHVADLSPRRTDLALHRAHRAARGSVGLGGGKLNATSLLLEPLAARVRAVDGVPRPGRPARSRAWASGSPPRQRAIRSTSKRCSPWFANRAVARSRCLPRSRRSSRPASTRSIRDVRVVLERGAVEGEHRGAVAQLVPDELRVDVDSHLSTPIRKELIWLERALTAGDDAYRFRRPRP